MTDVVLTRLDEKKIEELNEISERERTDRYHLKLFYILRKRNLISICLKEVY